MTATTDGRLQRIDDLILQAHMCYLKATWRGCGNVAERWRREVDRLLDLRLRYEAGLVTMISD